LDVDGDELTDIILYDLNQMGSHEQSHGCVENRECVHREYLPETDKLPVEETKMANIDIQAVRYEYEEPEAHEEEVFHSNQDWSSYQSPEIVATVAEPQGDTAEEDDEEFRQLLFVVEQYIGKPLKQTDCDMFAYLYKELSMSSSLLEYLVDYCVTNQHNNIRYMETVALDWHEHHIQTLEQAKRYVPVSKKDMYTVMKALGLGGRQPAPAETKWLDKWFIDDGFCLELILEACNRTISSIHSPSFRYADKILENWKENGVKQIQDIQSLDEQHQSNQQNMIAVTTTTVKHRLSGKSAKPNKFHNFDQRDYDYDALLHHLNGTAQ
jgi:DnaD/phage-associated family protein